MVGVVGCSRLTEQDPIVEAPIAPGQTSDGKSASTSESNPDALFEEVSSQETGVDFTHRLDPDHPKAYLYHSGYTCGGVCVGDVNGDGLSDIFLVSGPDDNALFINKGDFKFEKSLASYSLSGEEAWGVGASMTDVDGDGDLDIYVCNYDAPNRLYLNEGIEQGQLRFTECASDAGLAYAGPSQCPYFADLDGDGKLDLFLLTNRLYAPFGRPQEIASELGPDGKVRIKEKYAKYFRVVLPDEEAPSEAAQSPPPFMLEYGHADRIYRNEGVDENGQPRFRDITEGSGIEESIGHGLSALIWDINEDGRPDLYVANDYTDPDRLWINEGTNDSGTIQFRDATEEYVPYTTWSSMGSDIADVDNDGRLDFLVADMAATTHFKAKSTMGEMSGWRRWVLENGWPRQAMRNMLFVNSGVGRYQEAGYLAGVAQSDWTWAVKFADYDLDGHNDLFLTNGSARVFSDSDIIVKPTMLVGRTEWEIFRDRPEMRERNVAFQNKGNLQFEEVSQPWNLDKEGMSYGAASGDFDGDGDLDLVVCNLNDEVSLYRNRASESGAHWLKVKLEGKDDNRFGMGARVRADLADGTSLLRLMNPQTGFLSVNEPILHFGLGKATEVTRVEVQWPDGTVQQVENQPADQLITIRQTDEARTVSDETPKTQFVQVAEEIGLNFKHKDKPYNDYQREFLLPGKQSQFGPGIAVADINGDQTDDLFVGGAAGQAGAIFIQQADHRFKALENPPWNEDATSEDMGAIFFDADRDGDLDLYVVSGSNEWGPGALAYRDRLYLNETQPGGEVSFVAADSSVLPKRRDSGSCVVGTDYDRDGDVDLFVGSRSVAGQYLITPESTLLRNDSNKAGHVQFTDVTETIAPALRRAGLVTGAIWSDVDDDGWSDLLVTCEWGPVRLFYNQQGKLVDVSESVGTENRNGWWNAITAADFDGDGDIDYAALNVGLNTKYGHPSAKKPATLYRGDMDHNGVFDLVEAKMTADGELPVRGRSCSCRAMPTLRDKFPTYKQFASADLLGIYEEGDLSSATKAEATEFETGIWINESTPGQPRFTWQPLPMQTQISPCYGSVATDLFADGATSLTMVQNLYSREPETGLWRGGLGCLLRPNAANSQLEPVSHEQSGFMVGGDGKGLAVADLDGDGRPDLIATQNNDPLLAFRQNSSNAPVSSHLCVRLIGPPGNPDGIGSQIKLVQNEKVLGTAEIYGGSGYLSQSAAAAFFARPPAGTPSEIVVRWPDGSSTTVPVDERSTIHVEADAP